MLSATSAEENMVVKYGTARKIPGMPGLSGVQEHEAVSGKDRCSVSEVRKRSDPAQDEKRTEILWMRKQSGMRFHVLAETVCQEMPAVRRLYAGKRQ